MSDNHEQEEEQNLTLSPQDKDTTIVEQTQKIRSSEAMDSEGQPQVVASGTIDDTSPSSIVVKDNNTLHNMNKENAEMAEAKDLIEGAQDQSSDKENSTR
ncbi:hypothetical protein K7X08_002639 [Anisodus acutangulus]|uniref:Uncharacterized protein n=1 Tax=Anisodus acutangulus TaxID=402998 RepID=A0A9Q1LTW5_9SOLA|nr:hypothetical protein K7X08_002639 [Anisodus acutangulus]